MSFIGKLFGLDSGAQKRQAEQQAALMREQAESSKRQSQAIADQSANQTRLAQDRARVEEQVRLMQESAKEDAPEIDIGAEGEEEAPTRRRRSYQNPNAGASGSVRI